MSIRSRSMRSPLYVGLENEEICSRNKIQRLQVEEEHGAMDTIDHH